MASVEVYYPELIVENDGTVRYTTMIDVEGGWSLNDTSTGIIRDPVKITWTIDGEVVATAIRDDVQTSSIFEVPDDWSEQENEYMVQTAMELYEKFGEGDHEFCAKAEIL